jgi:hypothetical protein
MKIKGIGKQGLPTRRQSEVFASCSQALMNTQIVRGTSDDFRITPNNMTIQIKDASASANTLGMHPFKIYATGEVDINGHRGYQVRSGTVEIRPRFHQFFSTGLSGWFASFNQGNYSSPFVPTNSDGAFPDQNLIVTPATFFLDPTAEIVGGVNYGSYYAFWVQITPDTDNGGAYDGAVSIQYHRFTANPGASIYDAYVYPSLPASVPDEILPIGVVQVTTETAFGVGLGIAPGADGDVYQHKRDHYTGRFPADNNSLNGSEFQGDWIISGSAFVGTAGVNSGNRWWYPGDWVDFFNYDTPSNFDGVFVWVGSPGQLGGTPTNPFDGASQFIQISKLTMF